MRKHAFILVFAAAIALGSFADRAHAQLRLGGRYRGYGFTPSHVYNYYGPSYGGFSFGPNMNFNSTYDPYPGLPPAYPTYSVMPAHYYPPVIVAPAPLPPASSTVNPYTPNYPDAVLTPTLPPAGTTEPR